jgi:hypothetical protein
MGLPIDHFKQASSPRSDSGVINRRTQLVACNDEALYSTPLAEPEASKVGPSTLWASAGQVVPWWRNACAWLRKKPSFQ